MPEPSYRDLATAWPVLREPCPNRFCLIDGEPLVTCLVCNGLGWTVPASAAEMRVRLEDLFWGLGYRIEIARWWDGVQKSVTLKPPGRNAVYSGEGGTILAALLSAAAQALDTPVASEAANDTGSGGSTEENDGTR
ncbi:MAG: hypothetical protein Q8R28_14185 [Dehalococcoidia bacterium]|nr:hypothetical protein [Dehalococcoidia bacterium]